MFFLAAVMVQMPFRINGQIRVDVKKKVVNQTNTRANRNADQAISKGLDEIENSIKGTDKKEDEKEKGTQATKETETPVESKAEEQPILQTYSNYDFIAGEKVIFYDDFSQVNVGDFPAGWNTNGSGEVVTTNLHDGKWFKIKGSESRVVPEITYLLPDNFTIEFDVIPQKNSKGGDSNSHKWGFYILNTPYIVKSFYGSAYNGIAFNFGHTAGYNTRWSEQTTPSLGGTNSDLVAKEEPDTKYHISVWVQKTRIRLYQNENKVWDLPRALSSTIKLNSWRLYGGEPMITNFRVAVGAPDMRSKLITEGKLISYGIYFDVNKDVVKPESYGTLKGIAAILTENPDVRVKIIGHTDSDGADPANLELSKRRGASVKDALVKNFSIDASRLESDGKGETEPVAQNDIPVNKALNRRVEFIKL